MITIQNTDLSLHIYNTNIFFFFFNKIKYEQWIPYFSMENFSTTCGS